MSKLIKHPIYNEKQLKLQNVNAWVHLHDLTCSCTTPLQCIILQINNQEPNLQFTKQQQAKLQTWLTSTAAGNQDGEDVVDGFGPGELDALFANDGEDATG